MPFFFFNIILFIVCLFLRNRKEEKRMRQDFLKRDERQSPFELCLPATVAVVTEVAPTVLSSSVVLNSSKLGQNLLVLFGFCWCWPLYFFWKTFWLTPDACTRRRRRRLFALIFRLGFISVLFSTPRRKARQLGRINYSSSSSSTRLYPLRPCLRHNVHKVNKHLRKETKETVAWKNWKKKWAKGENETTRLVEDHGNCRVCCFCYKSRTASSTCLSQWTQRERERERETDFVRPSIH